MKFEVDKLYIDCHGHVYKCKLVEDDQALLQQIISKCMFVTRCDNAYQYNEYQEPQTVTFAVLFIRSKTKKWTRYSSYEDYESAVAEGRMRLNAGWISDYYAVTYVEKMYRG